MFPESFGLVLIILKSISFESTGVASLFSLFKLMEIVLSSVVTAVASFVRKRNSLH